MKKLENRPLFSRLGPMGDRRRAQARLNGRAFFVMSLFHQRAETS